MPFQNQSQPIDQATESKKPKTWLTILLTAVITGIVIGFSMYFIMISTLKTNEGTTILEQKIIKLQQIRQSLVNKIHHTDGWLTYTNLECNFQIKYPDTWIINNDRSSSKEVVFNVNGDSEDRESIRCEKTNTTPEEWLEKIDKSIIVNTENIPVANRLGLKIETSKFGITQIATQYKNKLYIIETSGGKMIDNGILSTFEFLYLDVNDISNWQTYTNEEYGFEFKYPKDWEIKKQETKEAPNRIIPINQENCSDIWGKNTCLDDVTFNILNEKLNNLEDIRNLLRSKYQTDDAFFEASIRNLSKIKLNSYNAYNYTEISAFDGDSSNTYLIQSPQKTDIFIKFSYNYLLDNQKIIYNQILSTFKFLD